MQKEVRKMLKKGMAKSVFSGIIMLAFLGIFGYMIFSYVQKLFIGVPWIDVESYNDYTYLDAQYISDSFASNDDGAVYVFVTTEEDDGLYDFIAKIPEDLYESSQVLALRDFVYSNDSDDEKPSILRIKGVPDCMDSELRDMAVDAYAYYYPDSNGEVDFNKYVASNILDATVKPQLGFNENTIYFILFIIAFISLFFGFIKMIFTQLKKSQKVNAAKELLENDANYIKAIEEIKDPTTQFFKKCKLYITPNYLITYQDGLDIWPANTIWELYGYDKNKYSALRAILIGTIAAGRNEHLLVAVTNDGVAHEFAIVANKAPQIHSQIVGILAPRQVSMTLGRNSAACGEILPYISTLNVSQLKGFYGSDAPWQGRAN